MMRDWPNYLSLLSCDLPTSLVEWKRRLRYVKMRNHSVFVFLLSQRMICLVCELGLTYFLYSHIYIWYNRTSLRHVIKYTRSVVYLSLVSLVWRNTFNTVTSTPVNLPSLSWLGKIYRYSYTNKELLYLV